MRSQLTTNIAAYSLLATTAVVSILLPSTLGPRHGVAAPPGIAGETYIDVGAVARDFKKGHPDFGTSISGGNGHYAGNVTSTLDSNGKPNFVGVISTPVTNFNITNGATVPRVEYTPMVTVVGSAITYGGAYDCPVTVKVHIGSSTFEPFGTFGAALAGNVNKTGNPQAYVHPSSVAANTGVYIEGRAWIKKQSSYSGTSESHWQAYSTFSSSPTTAQIKVLKNGDSVPNVSGFQNQSSVKTYLQKYVNTTTKKVTLQSNQSIYLFEFGSTSGAAADFQDLVVLVTLGETTTYLNTLEDDGTPPAVTTTPKGFKVSSQWRDDKGNAIPPHLFGTATGDVAGSKGSASTGGIYSAQSFEQWYTDVMGTNLSAQVNLRLTKNDGVWEYLSDDFHPIDDAAFGNEGKDHNHYFTMNFGLDFTHHAGERRFMEFQGDDDVWVFVDGKLAMDLGGISPGTKQHLDIDRIPGLSDGAQHHIEFFYAQRQENSATFRLRTNLDLGSGTTSYYTVTSVGD